MTLEEKFQDLLGTMEKLVSDVRVAMDYIESDIAHWHKEGIKGCSSHTSVEHTSLLQGANDSLYKLWLFRVLLGNYHAMSEHMDDFDAATHYALRMSVNNLEQEYARYKTLRTQEEGAIPNANAHEGWLDRLKNQWKLRGGGLG